MDKVNILINLSRKTAVFVDLFVYFGKEPSMTKQPHRHIPPQSATVGYHVADHLGSVRAIWDVNAGASIS